MNNRETIISEIEQRLEEGWDASCFTAEACRIILSDMRRVAELAAAAGSTGELRRLLQQAKWIGQQTTAEEFSARAVFADREQAHEAYRALVQFRDGSA